MYRLLSFILSFALGVYYIEAQCFFADTLKLTKAYENLQLHPCSYEAQKDFFDQFPNSWVELYNTYAYVYDDPKTTSLYCQMENHFDALSIQLLLIDDSLYCSKLIGLAIDATLRLDEVSSVFRRHLRETLANHDRAEVMLDILFARPEMEQLQFWQFYWSNIIDDKMGHNELLLMNMRLTRMDRNKEAELMNEAFKHFYGKSSSNRGGTLIGNKEWQGRY